jgi:hypothetical protein
VSADVKEWEEFGTSLGGGFSARARGLLGSEFSISGRNGELVVRLEGPGRASFESDGFEGRVEHLDLRSRELRALMLVGDGEVLTAERDGSGFTIEAREASFSASVSLARNSASARSPDGEREIARVSGGFTNRSYEASFERGNFDVALFLFCHLASARRRAFRSGTPALAGE